MNDLRDDELSRRLKAAWSAERAPGDWVRAALEIPGQAGILDTPDSAAALGRSRPASEPWLVELLPHLCGLALLVGLALALALYMAGAGADLPKVAELVGQSSPGALLLFFLAPIFVFLIVESARGFPLVRKWMY